MIIAIGFRVRSSTGTKFRIWANEKLKEYSELEYKKYKIEQKRVEKEHSLKELEEDIKRLK